jgi:hypothetical protein
VTSTWLTPKVAFFVTTELQLVDRKWKDCYITLPRNSSCLNVRLNDKRNGKKSTGTPQKRLNTITTTVYTLCQGQIKTNSSADEKAGKKNLMAGTPTAERTERLRLAMKT